jgi:anti-sigma B factor antagonist
MSSLETFPVQWQDALAVVTLPPEIDIANADLVCDTLLAVLNRGVATLIADMTGTTFCACAGVTALVRAQQRAAANDAQLRVAVTAPVVLRLMAMTGLDRLVPVSGTVAGALAGPGGQGPRHADEDPAQAAAV